ncbi:hypothetical protein [Micromonospora sp. WMMD1082]|uniref:hypothetical protein n=1 Tax=Micromonospora sp. WMMD1082 TaxID=3016104 RepID=UPI0024180D1D|nr:hypothetical protein [Micromonospora sp. WMMD1082]MDG4794272.1 hypothetical protein [Micromonospora sp. WMMD1082]
MHYNEIRREADLIVQELQRVLAGFVRTSDVAPVDPEDFREMVWAGESRLGTETLCEQLVENGVLLPVSLAQRLRRFGESVGVAKSYIDRIGVTPGE